MKKIILLTGLAAALVLSSCGGSKKTDENTGDSTTVKTEKGAKDICTYENKISLTIKDYKKGTKKDFQYETANFEVIQSSWKYKNDSTAELKLSNYKQEELTGDRKDDQVDIIVKFRARKGEKLKGGVYPYNEYSENHDCGVTMMTSTGEVWFNWSAGMPEQGDVTVDFIDKDNVCGSFALNVEKPTADWIGTVRLNGTFKVSK